MKQYVHSFACMGTVVTMQVRSDQEPTTRYGQRDESLSRATAWFQQVERCCNRFDASSELRRLCEQPDRPVPVSEVLFECVQFALAVAHATSGAFDPTVGARMEQRGFDRDYRSGSPVPSAQRTDATATYRDIELHNDRRAITLHKRLLLDLGAVAKGLAIDMAVRELRELRHFMINAGGDVYLGGRNAADEPWSVGIRNPRATDVYLHTYRVSDIAVCTSGDYERIASDGSGHILDARRDEVATALASVTVLAPSAMVADALATAAFALGPDAGRALLVQQGVDGLLITPDLQMFHTESVTVE